MTPWRYKREYQKFKNTFINTIRQYICFAFKNNLITIILMRIKYLNPYFLLIFIILIFGGHILSLAVGEYYKIWWADIVLHFFGGFWLGLLALWFIFNSGKFPFPTEKAPLYILILAVLSFAALIGVLWEFFEFILDEITGYKSYSAVVAIENFEDTIADLFFDIFGAFLSGVFLKFRKKL